MVNLNKLLGRFKPLRLNGLYLIYEKAHVGVKRSRVKAAWRDLLHKGCILCKSPDTVYLGHAIPVEGPKLLNGEAFRFYLVCKPCSALKHATTLIDQAIINEGKQREQIEGRMRS